MSRVIAIDAESGAPIYAEQIRTTIAGESQLVSNLQYETIERITQPPESVLAWLQETP